MYINQYKTSADFFGLLIVVDRLSMGATGKDAIQGIRRSLTAHIPAITGDTDANWIYRSTVVRRAAIA